MTYIDPNQRLFSGEDGSCNHNDLGKCCDPKGGAVRNKQLGGRLLMTTYGVQSVISGSAYMYDAASTAYNAYRAGASMAAAAKVGMSAASAAAGAAVSSTFSMSAYGLSMTYTAGTAATATSAAIPSSFSYAFDPTSLAIAVAIMIIVDLSSCEEPEKVLAQKQGAGLCRQYSSVCNGFFCASITKRFCCFNSKLAKIINTAAVYQSGKALSDCTGLTMAEFGKLDFSAIDMSEFTAEIMSNLELPAPPTSNTSNINIDVNTAVKKKLENYYTTGKQ
jgi:conjugal transfer mating pair stabilization protein TraN